MKKWIKFNTRGYTIIEMSVSIFIFSLILIGLFEILSIGLKCWQIGDISTETQQSAEIAIHRIMSELKFSNNDTYTYDDDPNREYLCFNTSMKAGKLEYDFYNQTPIWQAHIAYYTLPNESNSKTRTLYRRFIPCPSSPVPVILNPSAPTNYLVETANISTDPEEHLKVISKNVKRFEVTPNGDLITIKLTCFKSMGDRKLAYEQNFDNTIGSTIEVTASIAPRN